MNWKQRFRLVFDPLVYIGGVGSGIFVIMLALGWISGYFGWGKNKFFSFFKDNIQVFCHWAIITCIFFIAIWRLRQRFIIGFSDNFKKDLRVNWDYKGGWQITDNVLCVKGVRKTPDEEGIGITKVGTQWENYAFTFKARIMNDCLGVIIRAQDFNNFYMFQIRTDCIVPHRRVTVPKTSCGHKITFETHWEKPIGKMSLSRHLDDWFDTKVIVRGQSVRLYINNRLVLQEEFFLRIPTGKVGFRNWVPETALVKNVKVTLQP